MPANAATSAEHGGRPLQPPRQLHIGALMCSPAPRRHPPPPTSASRRNWPPAWPRKRASGRRPRSSTTSSRLARCGCCTSGSRMSAGSTCGSRSGRRVTVPRRGVPKASGARPSAQLPAPPAAEHLGRRAQSRCHPPRPGSPRLQAAAVGASLNVQLIARPMPARRSSGTKTSGPHHHRGYLGPPGLQPAREHFAASTPGCGCCYSSCWRPGSRIGPWERQQTALRHPACTQATSGWLKRGQVQQGHLRRSRTAHASLRASPGLTMQRLGRQATRSKLGCQAHSA